MKRIYLLMLFVVAIAANSFGRSVDLRINHYIAPSGATTYSLITNSTNIFSNGDTTSGHAHSWYHFAWAIGVTSTSTDTVQVSDTMIIKSYTIGSYVPVYGYHIGKGDSIFIQLKDSLYFLPGSYTQSGSKSINACDSIFMYTGPFSSANVVPDPSLMNNETCNTITFNYWATSVGNLSVIPNEVILYPNPATKQLNLMYNFETGSKGANIAITDATGRTVLTQDLGHNLTGSQTIQINNIATLPSGMYFLQLRTEEGKTALTKFNITAE